MSKAAIEPKYTANVQRVRGQIAWLAEQLSDDRRFVEGDAPGALDLAYFQTLWLIRGGKPKSEIDVTLCLKPVLPWFERMAAIGHDHST